MQAANGSFGYEVSKEDNNKLVVDPVASEVVKEIYDLYLKGMGFTGISHYLNDKNIPCPSLYKYRKGGCNTSTFLFRYNLLLI